jgi:hypothetical protein
MATKNAIEVKNAADIVREGAGLIELPVWSPSRALLAEA